MTVKERPNRNVRIFYYNHRYNGSSAGTNYAYYNTGSERIEYDTGARLPNGRWPWKYCHHVCTNVLDPVVAKFSYDYAMGYGPNKNRSEGYTGQYLMDDRDMAGSAPSGSFNNDVVRNLMSQVDLNSGEAVLLYSGVIQAIPLLGSVGKLSSILNHAARNLSKSFRKKPFTTVVKSLISTDFIDRFVISPMIDDARRFADATNYVLNTIRTAEERNANRFALQSASTRTVSHSVSTRRMGVSGDLPSIDAKVTKTSYCTSKAFMLLEATYHTDALTPLKLWARRTGLTRPLDSVWDLVPFSFVVDYFTRAGDFISRLSDEMSRVEGLTGTITRIHDMWCSFERTSKSEMVPIAVLNDYGPNFSDPYFELLNKSYSPAVGQSKNSDYRRYQIENPWLYLSSLQETINDYLSINLDISSIRKRTIAELVIQAKL